MTESKNLILAFILGVSLILFPMFFISEGKPKITEMSIDINEISTAIAKITIKCNSSDNKIDSDYKAIITQESYRSCHDSSEENYKDKLEIYTYIELTCKSERINGKTIYYKIKEKVGARCQYEM